MSLEKPNPKKLFVVRFEETLLLIKENDKRLPQPYYEILTEAFGDKILVETSGDHAFMVKEDGSLLELIPFRSQRHHDYSKALSKDYCKDQVDEHGNRFLIQE